MYTGPKIEITGYQKGSILKPDEMDALRGGQDTAMGVMLDKLDKRSKLEKEVSEVSKQDNNNMTDLRDRGVRFRHQVFGCSIGRIQSLF